MKTFSEKEILQLFEETKKLKPEFNVICHPSEYSTAQRLVSGFIEYFIRDCIVIWSKNGENHRRVSAYYTDTKKEGGFLQGRYPEENWDTIAEKFFESEYENLIVQLPYDKMKLESQIYLKNILKQAEQLFKTQMKKNSHFDL